MRYQPRVRAQEECCEPRMDERTDRQENRRKESMEEWRTGMLPASAPLANPYVPFQRNNPPTYPAKHGVVRGTLFPGLDLPYRGKVNEGTLSETHLHELQALGFAMTELGEYLDTHPDDKEAFELFRSYAELYRQGREKYEKMHGPLTQKGSAEYEKYVWLNDPWPWDYGVNKEG